MLFNWIFDTWGDQTALVNKWWQADDVIRCWIAAFVSYYWNLQRHEFYSSVPDWVFSKRENIIGGTSADNRVMMASEQKDNLLCNLTAESRLNSLRSCTCVSPSLWRRSLWLRSPGSRAGSSSRWRSAAVAECCTAKPASLWRHAMKRPASGLGEGPGCFPGGRGCRRSPHPGRWVVGKPCCGGSRWQLGAGRRCGAAEGGRRRRLHLSQRGHRTGPSSGTRTLHCPVSKYGKCVCIFKSTQLQSNHFIKPFDHDRNEKKTSSHLLIRMLSCLNTKKHVKFATDTIRLFFIEFNPQIVCV